MTAGPGAWTVPTVLYRHFDTDGNLLYVGSTELRRLRDRHLGHVRNARWWLYVARVEHEEVEDRRNAYKAETAAIHAERPVFNRTSGSDDQQEREAEYIRHHSAIRAVEVPVWPRPARTAQLDRILREVGVPVPEPHPRSVPGQVGSVRLVALDLGEYMARAYSQGVIS